MWQTLVLSRTHQTQEICCFLADVQIILVSLFEFFDYIKVAKNAGAFLSRCSELLDLSYLFQYVFLTHELQEFIIISFLPITSHKQKKQIKGPIK